MVLPGWSYGREFTFAAVAEAADGVQCDLLLSADNFAGGFTAAQSDGADLRVTDGDDNLLPFYLHFFKPTEPLALLTVLTPLGTAATSVWVWAGNAAATSVSSTDDTYHKAARGSGVLAAYDFDETSGSSVVDKVGSADFTIVNSPTRVAASPNMRIGRGISPEDPTFTAGNGYITFDGVNQYATAAGAMPDAMAEGGIAFDYLCPDSTAESGNRVLSKVNAGGTQGVDLFVASAAVRFRKIINSVGVSLSTANGPRSQGWPTTPFQDNRVYHICVTWGARGMEIWVDGILNVSNATTTGYSGATRPLTLGAFNYQEPPTNYANVTLGGLTVWDHQPTAREITEHMRRRSVVAESDTQLTKLTRNPTTALISPTKTKHDTAVYEPNVIPPDKGPDDNWHCFYSGGFSGGGGSGGATWYAVSADGVNWTHPYDDPIVGQGFGGLAGDAVRNKTVWDSVNSQWVMFVSENSTDENKGLRRLTSSANPPTAESWVLEATPVIANNAESWLNFVANSELFQFEDDSYLLTFDLNNANAPPQWIAGQATGPSLTGDFTVIPTSNVDLAGLQIGTGIYSTIAIKKVGSIYYGWGHMSIGVAGSLPTECYAFVSADPRSDWHPRYGGMPFLRLDDAVVVGTDRDQTADVDEPIEYGGKTIFHYDYDDNSDTLEAVIVRSEYAGTLAEFVADAPAATVGDEVVIGAVTRAWKAMSKAAVAKALSKSTTWKGR